MNKTYGAMVRKLPVNQRTKSVLGRNWIGGIVGVLVVLAAFAKWISTLTGTAFEKVLLEQQGWAIITKYTFGSALLAYAVLLIVMFAGFIAGAYAQDLTRR